MKDTPKSEPVKDIPKDYIGVDVSKGTLDIGMPNQTDINTIDNDTNAIEQWLCTLDKTRVRIVFEPTGGYEFELQTCLAEQGFEACRVDATRTYFFRRQRGVMAKTDANDAQLLRDFGQSEHPDITRLPDTATRRF